MSPLRKELEKHLKEMCQEIGFKKNRSSYYITRVDEDTYGTLGFSIVPYQKKGHLFLSFLVGVSYSPLVEIFSKYAEINFNGIYPTLSNQIGYFTPTHRFFEWDYHADVDNVEFFNEVKDTIIRYGYPVFQKYSDPDALMEAFNCGDVGASIVSLTAGKAILYYLKGDKDKALACLEERRIKNQKFGNEAEVKFDENFRKLLSGGQKLE